MTTPDLSRRSIPRWPGVLLALALAGQALPAAAADPAPPAADPFPPVQASGTVPLRLACGAEATGPRIVAFGLPFPRGFAADAGRIRLEDTAGEVAADVTELARWRHFNDPAIDGKSIRAVLITFRHDCSKAPSADYTVRWGQARTLRADAGITPANVAERTWGPQADAHPLEHPQTDNYAIDAAVPALREPAVWVSPPAAWLMQCNLRGPVAPIRAGIGRDWQTGFMRTYVNDVAADVSAFERNENGQGLIHWGHEFEGWLYDRPAVLWNTYVQTGDPKWQRHAHRATQYYAAQIALEGRRGSFAKRPGDAKYAHAGGLFSAYLLTGDARLLDRIRAVAEMVGSVNTRLPPFERTTGLWTERHMSVAIGGALSAWEATGEAAYRDRLLRIVEGLRADATRPPPGYPGAEAMSGVLLHRPEVHEEGSFPDVVMSPWMAALMTEALWRYHLHSDDRRALQILGDYAQFVAERAIEQQGVDWAPRYLAGLKGNYEGIEAEHAFDVMGLLARGRWARLRLGQPVAQIDTQIARLRVTADATFSTWVRNSAGLPRYRLAPTRKAGWWYGSTYDLAWFGYD
jgi:hypothetical protein